MQSITINNLTYDNTSERTFDVPTTVPANARLSNKKSGNDMGRHIIGMMRSGNRKQLYQPMI
ncbi:hypothetical protein [Chryseobacterium indoltheticum]|uniref:hypothetical protein n=1 Tax=Chryseobacterium indoltheticum TaxID=254 RepID=UPI003F4927E0